MNVVPETRQAALHRQRRALNDTLNLLPDDLPLARYPNRQGLGSLNTI